MTRVAFIIGCARSGTCWLGQVLQQNEGFRVTIEDPLIFPLVDTLALYPDRVSSLLPKLISLYEDQILRAAPDFYIDKSHQNIWLVEPLITAFEEAQFIAIERSPYGAVASMLRHSGVLGHFWRWRSYPVPNYHLGVTSDLVDEYDHLPLTVKCALRWRSHYNRLNDLQYRFARRILRLNYEQLITNEPFYSQILEEFLGKKVTVPLADRMPLEKWKTVLSNVQIKMIDEVVQCEASSK